MLLQFGTLPPSKSIWFKIFVYILKDVIIKKERINFIKLFILIVDEFFTVINIKYNNDLKFVYIVIIKK